MSIKNHLFTSFLSIIIISYSSSAYASLYLSGALKAGYSTEVSEDKTTILSRKMASYSAEAAAGFRITMFIFGINGEYAFIKQLTDPANVSNINTQGKLMAVSPLLGVTFGRMRLLAKLPTVLTGNYKLDQKNASGNEVTYKDATIFGGQLQWMNGPHSFWGFEYQKLTFKKISSGGTEASLSNSSYLNLSTVSLMYGFSY